MLFGLFGLMVPAAAFGLPADYFASSSRLATPGRWVKVKVTETGMHRISYDQLREWGFPNPEAVNVYGFSGLELAENDFHAGQPDDLPPVATIRDNDNLVFYAEGGLRVSVKDSREVKDYRNHYSDYTILFLSDVALSDPAELPVKEYVEQNVIRTTHYSFDYHEPELQNPSMAGNFYFTRNLWAYPEDAEFTLHVEDRVGTAFLSYVPVAKIQNHNMVKFYPTFGAGISRTNGNRDRINSVGSVGDEWDHRYYSTMPNPTLLQVNLTEGQSDYDIKFEPLTSISRSDMPYFYIDYACLLYERYNRLKDRGRLPLQFLTLTPETNIRVSLARPTTQVWDVTDALHPVSLEGSWSEDYQALFVSPERSGWARLEAFNLEDADKFLTPEYVGEVVSPQNLHADQGVYDMVIITNATFMPHALELAELHEQKQGFKVKVVDQEHIYNEFSSGAPSAIAYHRYLKMLYDRNPDKLKYLLLFGRGSFDNRKLTEGTPNHLMTYQCEERRGQLKGWYRSATQSFAPDNYFGMLGDDFSRDNITKAYVHLGVGRVPVLGAGQAADYVKKAKSYFEEFESARPFFSRILATSDHGDDNAHLDLAEENVNKALAHHPGLEVTKVYSAVFDRSAAQMRTRLGDAFARGVGYYTYSGHGATSSLGANGAVGVAFLDKVSWGNHPLVCMSTCDPLGMDRSALNVGVSMLNNPNGPYAMVGAHRSVYLDRNRVIFNCFTDQLFAAEHGTPVGEVFRRAFNDVVQNEHFINGSLMNETDLAVNTLCYSLGGDPALPVSMPSAGVKFNRIGETTLGDASSQASLTALTPTKVQGSITDTDGNVITSFNGPATVTLLDGRFTVTTKESSTDSSTEVEVNDRQLAMVGTVVKNGEWEVMLSSGLAQHTAAAKLELTARDSATGRLAFGSYSGLSVVDPTDSKGNEDTSGPIIHTLYLNSPSFSDGDAVGSDATLVTGIDSDPSGVAFARTQIAAAPKLQLDGKDAYPLYASSLRTTTSGGYSSTFTLTDMSDGPHTLTVQVADNAGNVTMKRISFVVVNDQLEGTLDAGDGVAVGEISIDLLAGSQTKAKRLIIENAEGETVTTVESPSFPYVWDTTGLPEGLYRVFAVIQSDIRKGRTPELQITVISE